MNISAAGEEGADIIDGLLSGDKSRVDGALLYISSNKPQELIEKLSGIIIKDSNPRHKEPALKAFKSYPQRMTNQYSIEILKNTNSFLVKKEIIDYLSGSVDRQVVPPIIDELESPFFSVRESAALALKKIGDDRMFPRIINMLENPNPVYKVYGLEAIYYLYDLRFYNYLINILKDENKSIRYYVLKCIDANRLKEALPNIRNTALSDKSSEVRIKAVQILENFSDKDSLPVLLFCIKDEDREIRFAASKALNKLLFKTSAVPVSTALFAESDDDIKILLIKTLIALNDGGGFKGLRKVLLEDKNQNMRVFAAYALGCVKTVWSSAILLEGKDDASKEVRAEICNSLGYYNNKNIIAELLTIVNDDKETYVRSAALFSLKRLNSKTAVLPLFDRYNIETDPVIKEQMRLVLRALIKEAS